MRRVRCQMCLIYLPNMKSLRNHYMTFHSKIQIIQQFLKPTVIKSRVLVSNRRRKSPKKSVFLRNRVRITSTKDKITIFDSSNTINLIELTFPDSINVNVVPPFSADSTRNKKRSTGGNKKKKTLHIGIRRRLDTTISLDDHTGEFYECHCMEQREKNAPCEKTTTASDTESCSDTGKAFYCNFCGNGYNSTNELFEHESISHRSHCIHNGYVEHFAEPPEPVMKVYVCHICGFEFISSEILRSHFDYHFEQKVFEDVLDMELDYNNLYSSCNTSFSTGDYCTDLNNIMFYLTYPYDHFYSRNMMFMKVICDICYQEFFMYEYERHLKVAHFMRRINERNCRPMATGPTGTGTR